MSTISVALLQMTSCGTDQDANLAKGEVFCRRAREMGADVALFPEMWNIGYTSFVDAQESPGDLWRAQGRWNDADTRDAAAREEARARWQEQAIGRDDHFVARYQALAEELGMAVAITYLEKWDGAPRNSVSLIDRRGELLMTYAKVQTCDFDEPEASCTPGDSFPVCELDTEKGAFRVGAMICHDREFPEIARILMLEGAELILTPNSCELEANRLGQFRARAFENMVGVAMTNYAAPQENGHSVAFDGVAFDADGNARDTLVVEAGEGEGIYLAAFDMDEIRGYRSREVWGNAFRRPHRYGLLTSPEVEEPFIRLNAGGEAYDRKKR